VSEESAAPERSACIYGLEPSNFHDTRNQIAVHRIHLNSIGDRIYVAAFSESRTRHEQSNQESRLDSE
jgi:hypothetical protein